MPKTELGHGATVPAVKNRTWVTRTGVKVDRIASAWLIRRFIDKKGRIKCVPGKDYRPRPKELRFDMFDAEFTHEGDQCTFEVLIRRFGLRDHGLARLAEIIHDIDLKDGKFGRAETAGVDAAISGITLTCESDEDRLTRGSALFDGLHEHLSRAEDGNPSRRRRTTNSRRTS
jgi:hypothetical protein